MGHFPDRHVATVKATYRKEIVTDSGRLELIITDCSSQLHPGKFENFDAIIFVFSTRSKVSFTYARGLQNFLAWISRRGILIVLVGTKTDIEPRKVYDEEGEAFAQRIGAGYYTVSNKNPDNAGAPFQHLISQHQELYATVDTSPFESRLAWMRGFLRCGSSRKPKCDLRQLPRQGQESSEWKPSTS
ncbi:uncharacterized protein Z520_12186 [Fonsecaea multimorphosa CBS 102226]|uniref:Uncharacterized protein n=1 Tax=Fonsecaea multimorphosa CBS 102226 TaxID=1442371 RepID=A0A0D2JG23_9EURO|nr:uncharacterized protein Z520_12186 [Fonsecaea multimorphosa CBS 102226]KIX92102.1 hypothetical protein Z520_12186 [Fonsecaea multimorphosa CBS 102226]OAL17466.1 hypothetical protein AYO22_11598 [Fonsecaea multimorphosa]